MTDDLTTPAAATSAADPAVEAYGRAIVETARAEGVLPRVEEELFGFARAVQGSAELRERLGDPRLGVALRLELVEQLLEARAHPATVATASFVIQSGRLRQLSAIADAVSAVGAAARSESVAEVRSAVPLDEAQRDRLAAAVSTATGRTVTVRVIVDPSVVGGLVVSVGDTVIDGSVARKLDALRTALTGA